MNEFYYVKSELRGCKAGTKVRIHDWNDVEVQVSFNGTLEWIPKSLFNTFFTDDKNKVQDKTDLDGRRFYV